MLWYIVYLREKNIKLGNGILNCNSQTHYHNLLFMPTKANNHLGWVDKSQYLMKYPKNTDRFSSEVRHVFHLKSNTCILMRHFID